MQQLLKLESFDAPADLAPQIHPEFKRGFDEGKASCEAMAAAAQLELSQALAAKLSDSIFTFAEARQAVMSEFAPIVEAIVGSLIPTLSIAGLAADISEMVLTNVDESVGHRPKILVHPDIIEILDSALDPDLSDKIIVRPDDSVPIYSAWVSTEASETSLNFGGVVTAIQLALDAFQQTNSRKTENVQNAI